MHGRLFGCQVNAVDSQGLTALHRVAKQGNVQACRLLIQYGADLNIASLQGYTAAELAPESLQKILKGWILTTDSIWMNLSNKSISKHALLCHLIIPIFKK